MMYFTDLYIIEKSIVKAGPERTVSKFFLGKRKHLHPGPTRTACKSPFSQVDVRVKDVPISVTNECNLEDNNIPTF